MVLSRRARREGRLGMRRPELVLVTGAFGNLGTSVVRRLAREGFRVRAFDLPSAANRRAASRAGEAVEARFGDLTRAGDVESAVSGADAVVHLAGVLPPLSERNPAVARAVNVEGTRRLAGAAERACPDMPFVFASSCSVYGPSQRERGLAGADSPTEATDTYTETKLAAEEILRRTSLAWVVFRVGAAIEGSAAATDPIVLRLMFEIDPHNPIELVHREDVALAVARALVVPEAHRRVLPIGGGPTCRLTQRQLLETTLAAVGVSGLPDSAFGRAPYYTCWLDTEEAQRLLDFQQHDFERIRADVAARFARWRPILRLVAPLVRAGLLRLSGPHRGEPPRPTWRALIETGR